MIFTHLPRSGRPFQPALIAVFFLLFSSAASAQMITGTWKGKINRQKAEVKIIQQGDSLTGTSYYYESANNYRRYSIKGYFDPETNEAVWWDDQLLEEKSGRFSIGTPGKMPLLSRADFNCPGGGRMMLDGKVATRQNEEDIRGDVHLDKTGQPQFPDEWDFVIDNYILGANDPEIIDSVEAIAFHKPVTPPPPATRTASTSPVAITRTDPPPAETTPPPTVKATTRTPAAPKNVSATSPPPVTISQPAAAPAIEEKFKTRQRVFIKEIPVSGDSIELRFYDNAEVDGDSISLFLDNRLIFSHIRLTANPYIVKLPVAELGTTSELTMVAENLGAIPPNTSYMVAIVNGQRHDAYLSSSEGSSAMIRLAKK